MYIRDEDGFGLRPNIGLRGGNSDRSAKITLLEDGVPLSPAPYAAPAAYYFPMTMRIVGVEVIKGAAAIRHGPQTIGGAINLRTRRVPVNATIAGVDTAYGAFNTLKAHGFTGYGTEQWGVWEKSRTTPRMASRSWTAVERRASFARRHAQGTLEQRPHGRDHQQRRGVEAQSWS